MKDATCYSLKIWRQGRALKRGERKALREKREAWLKQIAPEHLFFPLFDLLPDVYFFAKNRQGELMFLSSKTQKLYQIAEESQVIGMSDFDLNPEPMAQAYVQDDEDIYRTGKPLLHRVELWFDRFGIPEWFLVNKLPILARSGKIIGIMGFSQSYEGRAKLLSPLGGIARAVSFLRENYQREVTLAELSRTACLSSRQLQRNFKAAFGIRPHEFLIKTRVLAACHVLRDTNNSLAEVALSCGFCDQSAFAQHFRKHVGVTPSQFRQENALQGER